MNANTIPAIEFRRLPGLYRRWELGQVIEPGEEYRIEDSGSAADGTTLYAVYKRASAVREDGPSPCVGKTSEQ